MTKLSLSLLGIACSSVASTAACYVTGQLIFFAILIIPVFAIIYRNWSRVLFISLNIVLTFFSISMIGYFAYRMDFSHELATASAPFFILMIGSLFSALFWNLEGVKKLYESRSPDLSNGRGWKCPKCSARVLYSASCWNCLEPRTDLISENPANKLEAFIKKQKGEQSDTHG